MKTINLTAKKSFQRICLLLLCTLFVTFIFTALHEGGHALAAVICGGTVSLIDVNIFNFSPHVTYHGVFAPGQEALIAISGWALPLLSLLLFLILSRSGDEPLLLMIRWIGGLSVLGSTLPWVALPLIYMGGGRPGDDVTRFLISSGLPPLPVALVFTVLVAAGIGLVIIERNRIGTILPCWAVRMRPQAPPEHGALWRG